MSELQEIAAATPKEPAWKRALPLLLAAALLAFVLSRIDFRAFEHALASVNAPAYLGFSLAFVFALLTADAFATVLVYRRTLPELGFVEFWKLRAASYLPSLLNHHVGQAFITWRLAKRHGVPLARVAGATLLVYTSWGGAVLGLGVLAIARTGEHLVWAGGLVLAGLLYLVAIALRPSFLTKRAWLSPLFEAGVKGHLVALALRVPHVIVLFAGTWLPFWFFGVDVPFGEALAKIPIMMVVVTLPITPQGIGTRDVLAATFFAAYGSPASIAASTTSWGVVITLCEALLGAVMFRLASASTEEASPPGTTGASSRSSRRG